MPHDPHDRPDAGPDPFDFDDGPIPLSRDSHRFIDYRKDRRREEETGLFDWGASERVRARQVEEEARRLKKALWLVEHGIVTIDVDEYSDPEDYTEVDEQGRPQLPRYNYIPF